MNDQPFSFLRTNVRESKPRRRGITEIRGPYYTPMGSEGITENVNSWRTDVVAEIIDSLGHERCPAILRL